MTVSELIAALSEIDNLDLPVIISDSGGNGKCHAEYIDTSILIEDGEGGFMPCCTLIGGKY